MSYQYNKECRWFQSGFCWIEKKVNVKRLHYRSLGMVQHLCLLCNQGHLSLKLKNLYRNSVYRVNFCIPSAHMGRMEMQTRETLASHGPASLTLQENTTKRVFLKQGIRQEHWRSCDLYTYAFTFIRSRVCAHKHTQSSCLFYFHNMLEG